MDLGRRLREARQRQSLSLYEVGDRTGLHFSTIAKYERGERRPDIDVLRELATVYDTSLGALLGEDASTAAFPESLQAVAEQLIRRRDLQTLLELCCRLRTEQLAGLLGFLHTLVPSPPPPADDAAPGDAAPPGAR